MHTMNLVRESSCNSARASSASGDVSQSPTQPSERRFDEEALSRMDDEGGSAEPAAKHFMDHQLRPSC